MVTPTVGAIAGNRKRYFLYKTHRHENYAIALGNVKVNGRISLRATLTTLAMKWKGFQNDGAR